MRAQDYLIARNVFEWLPRQKLNRLIVSCADDGQKALFGLDAV